MSFLNVILKLSQGEDGGQIGMERTDLVCLGDSIVYGYGVSERYAWPCLASRELGIHILNKGENGDTADGMNVRFMEDVVWNHPKEVFVMAGANDILMGIPQAHTERKYGYDHPKGPCGEYPANHWNTSPGGWGDVEKMLVQLFQH